MWTPPSVIFLDTETTWAEDGTDELHQLRLWVAAHIDRRKIKPSQGPAAWGWGQTAAELADWLTARMKGRECVWLYAHNLNFDLAVTALPDQLGRHGWTVSDFSVSGGPPWMRLKLGAKTLTVVDSYSWLPKSLEALGTLMDARKLALPDNHDSMHHWLDRCSTDVELLARAVLGLMEWWDARQLGRWTISGAGCGWNAMRHTASGERHVIDVTPELVAQDRLAIRGGRKDAAVIRSSSGGPWVELDLEGAYPTAARELPLPVKRAWTFDQMATDDKWITSRMYGVIASAVIDCDSPRYPVRHQGVTWYPVGRFTTTLAGPELAWAASNGDLVSVGAGQAHKLGLALRPWATWVLDPSEGGAYEMPAVAQVATKSWGRSTLGKFAARSSVTEQMEGVAPAGWNVTDCWDRRVGRRGTEVTMGGRRWLVTADADPENCYPAVLAWVESEIRVRLGRIVEALDGAWWTCDTDGLILDAAVATELLFGGGLQLGKRSRDAWGLAAAICDRLAPLVAPLRLRPKKVIDSLSVLGPQHLTAGDERRMAGVPRAAVETEPNTFVIRDWPRLKWQMNNAAPGTYRRPARKVHFSGPTVHRWVMDDGTTRPVEFRIDAQGANELVPWPETRWAGRRPGLAMHQYRLLHRVS